MSKLKEMDLNFFYGIVLREAENDTIQEVDPNIYTFVSEFIGNLKREEYDNVEAKVKDELVKITSEMTSLLLKVRLEKATKSRDLDYENLLDEEKYILDEEEERRERTDMILSATLNGKSKLLESVSQKHRTKSVVVRFLKEMDQMVGADMERYGPFKAEDVATLPYENAQALISKKMATKIRWDD